MIFVIRNTSSVANGVFSKFFSGSVVVLLFLSSYQQVYPHINCRETDISSGHFPPDISVGTIPFGHFPLLLTDTVSIPP